MEQLKKCFREPIPEIFIASQYLDEALNAHNSGDFKTAEHLILKADIPLIHEWAESILGRKSLYVKVIQENFTIPRLSKDKRGEQRMPNKQEKAMIIERDGHNCVFCGIPVIRPKIRNVIRKKYPIALKWGKKILNDMLHSLQCGYNMIT